MTDELKKIISEALFFTGAGFSKPAGCKLSGEMLKDLENKSNEENSNLFLTSERKAIKFILSCLDYQSRYRTLESNGKYTYSPNIEEFIQLLRRIRNRENLLPYPVTGNWSDKIITIEQDFKLENKNSEKDIWSSIEEKIKNDCYFKWLSINEKELNFLEPLKNFMQELNSDTKIEIFTLNNDLVLETYFKNENSVYTGFVSNKWVGFERDNVDNYTFYSSRINYYKLHGSIDWYRLTDGTVRKQTNDDLDEEKIEIKPLLIFGHGTKTFTVEPFFSLLEYFRNALRTKNYFIVIGYSFFDPHINNLFFNELISNTDKFMVIINPKISDNIYDDDFEKDLIKVLKKDSKQKLLEYFNNVQQNPIYAEFIDFNIKKISHPSIEYIKTNAEDFINKLENYLEFVREKVKEKEEEQDKFN